MAGLSDIAQVDAGQGISAFARGRSMAMQEDEAKMNRDLTVGKIVSQGAISADTPEKWSGFVSMLQKRFPQADLTPFQDFSTRQPMVDQLRNYASERSDDRADARQSNALASTNSRADRAFALEREKFDYLKSKPTEVASGNALVDASGKEVYRAPYKPASANMAPADKKAIFEAEDSNAGLESTIDILKRAKELNPKTFQGATAGVRGWVGTSGIPGSNMFLDKGAAEATREWGALMSAEAIKNMSATLKGASTDREMGTFMSILADPTAPPEQRRRVIERLETLAARQMKINADRANELRGGTYYLPGGGSSGGGVKPAAPPPPAGGQGGMAPPAGGNGAAADPRIDQARAAISRGADPAAVKKRLMDMGIDPGAL